MRTRVKVTNRLLLSVVVSCSLSLAACTSLYSHQPPVGLRHDPGKPYKVWVYCIDSSLSPRSDEFRELQLVLGEAAENDVDYNDLVWLIQIGSIWEPPKLFEMPPRSPNMRRESRIAAETELKNGKADLKHAIQRMAQISGTTDMGASLDAARAILAKYANANSRNLVIGSDFINDLGHGKASVDPPPTVLKNNLYGVNVDLLVTYPKPGYLKTVLCTTSAELLQRVITVWTTYLRDDGASSVNVLWVDAVPVSTSQLAKAIDQ